VVGVDPSPILLARATELSVGVANLSFVEGDGRELPVDGESFDVVVAHRVLSHVPGPERVLAEAFRVLRAGGWLAVFDGDYATITLATSDTDPLRVCVSAFRENYITDPWVVRRLPALIGAVGFRLGRFRSHGFAQVDDPDYMLSIAERGADALAGARRIGTELANALKAEARQRIEQHTFYGHVAYASMTAQKPLPPAAD